ncbi:MAG: RES domain-containing protein [Bacteroidota bacterium]
MAYDFSDKTFEQINNLYYDNALILPSVKEKLHPEAFENFYFYRVRMNIDFKSTDTNLINTYFYPPPSLCKKNGRSNIAGTSVFYCSDSANSAMHEMRPKINDEGFLSVWRIDVNRPMKLACLLPVSLKRHNPWWNFTQDIHKDQLKLWKKSYPKLTEHYKVLTNFIGRAYRLRDSKYSLSSFISKKLMFEDIYNDFILYPSFSTEETYANMAFHPNFVDNHMVLHKVFQFKIMKIIDGTAAFSIGLVGEMENGKMRWRRKNVYDRDVLDGFQRFTGDKNQ